MKTRDMAGLIVLGMLWGMSFLFIRVAAPEFGAFALMEVRVVLAAAILMPLVLLRRQIPELRRNWKPIFAMGVLHYAIPFSLFAWSMLTLTGGYSAIINATSPMFAGVVAWLWLGERPQASRVAGLLIGLVGVAVLVWDKLLITGGSAGLAVGASVLAAGCYGLAAVFARKTLAGVSPVTVSGGSMVAAALVLLPLSLWFWPSTTPSAGAWSMAVALGVICTAIGFVLYFQLIANIGPTKAITVTFLIPVFAVLLGAIFIDEAVTTSMIGGGLVVLVGTAMSIGLLDVRALIHRHRAIAVRVALLGILLLGLDDIPADLHTGGSILPVARALVSA